MALIHHELFDSLTEGILLLEESGKPFYANESFLQLLGLRARQIKTSKSVDDLFKIDSENESQWLKQGLSDWLTQLNPNQQASMIEVGIHSIAGVRGRVQITSQATRDHERNQPLFVFSFRDVDLETRLQMKYHGELGAKDKKIKEVSLLLDIAKSLVDQGDKQELIRRVIALLIEYKMIQGALLIEPPGLNGTQVVHSIGSEKSQEPFLLMKSIDFERVRQYGGLFPLATASALKGLIPYVPETFLKGLCFNFPLSVNDTQLGEILLFGHDNDFLKNDRDLELMSSVLSQLNLALESQEFWQRSILDPLTRIYNRRYFDLQFSIEIERARRNQSGNQNSLGLLILDVDYFKKVNDTYGHQAGDHVLKQLATILKKTSRQFDVVARYGGEEFVVLLPHTNEEIVQKVAERFRLAIESQVIMFESKHLPITISIGAAVYPNHGQTSDELISCADQALYEAKKSGRNKVILFQKLGSVPQKLLQLPTDIFIPENIQIFFDAGARDSSPKLSSRSNVTALMAEVGKPTDFVKLLTTQKFSSLIQSTQSGFARETRLLLELQKAFDLEEILQKILSDTALPDEASPTLFLHTLKKSDSKDELSNELKQLLNKSGKFSFLHECVMLTFEEFYMNAVFDAPAAVQPTGSTVAPTDAGTDQISENQPYFNFGFNNQKLILACEDKFGSFIPSHFLKKLESSHQDEKILTLNTGAGGAGIGNRIIIENCSELFLIHEPNKRTIFISTFERTNSLRKFESLLKNIFFTFKEAR